MAAKKKEVLTLSTNELDVDMVNINNNRVVQEKLRLPPEHKKGIILEGTDEEASDELVRLLRIEKII